MSEEPDTSEKPKRKYTRPHTAVPAINDIIDQAVVGAIEDITSDVGVDEDADVEIIDVSENVSDQSFIGQERVGLSQKAQIIKKFGTNESMRFTPWKGKDMWTCEICHWTTFKKILARHHACE